jgi:hypothetical protein
MRRCPDASGTGCVQLSPLPAMRRCPDASGTGCVQLNLRSDASLPGCVRNWMRPVNGDASLPGCVRNWMRPVKQRCVAARMCLELDASSQRRCVAARMRGKTWMRPVDLLSPRCVVARMLPVTGPGTRRCTGCVRWLDASSQPSSDDASWDRASLDRLCPEAGASRQLVPLLNAPGRWTWL